MGFKFADKIALVTGAGSGIGRETALALARKGCRLIISDVNPDGLQETQSMIDGVGACIRADIVDVADKNAMAAWADAINGQFGAVDILVNNAGVGVSGGILDTSLDDWEWIVSINQWGVIYGCHFFLPAMINRGSGHVVNVSSLLGFTATPGTLAYATTKFAVFGFSESLRAELAPHGIGVSTICPGIIKTGIIRNTRFRGVDDANGTRDRIDRMYRRRNYGPDKVATAIVGAIQRNRGVVPVSPESWGAWYLKRFTPGLLGVIGARTAGSQLSSGES